MALWSPGAIPSSNSSASLRVVSTKSKLVAASPPSFPSRKNFTSPPRKSIVPALSKKLAVRFRLLPPSSALRRHEPKSVIPSEARNWAIGRYWRDDLRPSSRFAEARGESVFDFPYTIVIEWIGRKGQHP